VNGIASVVRDNDVAYQSYFYNHQWATQLAASPLSLAAYRAAFGGGGPGSPAPAPATAAPVAPKPEPSTAAPTTAPTTHVAAKPVVNVNAERLASQIGRWLKGARRASSVRVRTRATEAGTSCLAVVAGSARGQLRCGTRSVRVGGAGRPKVIGSVAHTFRAAGDTVVRLRLARSRPRTHSVVSIFVSRRGAAAIAVVHAH
jgi:pyruvate/2-oxoglutarate dehydrogenase complex dihydrolipoamide acyltransferase (E2) component